MNLDGYSMGFEMFMEIRIYIAVVELKLIDLASQVMTCMVTQEMVKGKTRVVVAPHSINRWFILQEARQEFDLFTSLHSVESSMFVNPLKIMHSV
jgi:hypothetical protein